jgi:hypothetical protein
MMLKETIIIIVVVVVGSSTTAIKHCLRQQPERIINDIQRVRE